jgi:dGTPase
VGRSLGSLAGEFIVQNFENELTEDSKNFYLYNLNNVIAAACLCHDIGNPAFGHSGEDAIASFFEKNESELKLKFTEKEWADLVNFEGNANAIRILTHKQTVQSSHHFQFPPESHAAWFAQVLHWAQVYRPLA